MLGEESHLPGRRGGGDEGVYCQAVAAAGCDVLGVPTSRCARIFFSAALLLRCGAKC